MGQNEIHPLNRGRWAATSLLAREACKGVVSAVYLLTKQWFVIIIMLDDSCYSPFIVIVLLFIVACYIGIVTQIYYHLLLFIIYCYIIIDHALLRYSQGIFVYLVLEFVSL